MKALKLSLFKTHTKYDKHIVIKTVDKHSGEQMYMYINGPMLLAVNSYLILMINTDWSENALSTYCVMCLFSLFYIDLLIIEVLLIASACICYKL